MNKKIIYTCITDPKYSLKDFSYINEGYEYICFTTLRLKSKSWEVIKIQKEDIDSAKLSRKYKILHHKYFPDAEKTIWLDSKFKIDFDIEEFIKNNNIENNEFVLLKHPKRKCLYKEAEYCIDKNIGNKEDIKKQISKYKIENYPINNGLNSPGFMIRKNNNLINSVMDQWWEEVYNYSERDQISLNYILWKNKLDFFEVDFKKTCKILGL